MYGNRFVDWKFLAESMGLKKDLPMPEKRAFGWDLDGISVGELTLDGVSPRIYG
jgi:hypothetical protein